MALESFLPTGGKTYITNIEYLTTLYGYTHLRKITGVIELF